MNLLHLPTHPDSTVIRVVPVSRTIALRFPPIYQATAGVAAPAVLGSIYKSVQVVQMPAVFRNHQIAKMLVNQVSTEINC